MENGTIVRAMTRGPAIIRRVLRSVTVVACILLAAPAFAAPPTATPVSIGGTAEVGQMLNGVYNYADTDGDLEGISTYRWLRDGAAIPGAVGQAYTLVVADLNTLIVFEVTPVALTGAELQGVASPSGSVGPVVPQNTAPTAMAVAITGTPEVGQLLSGVYTYDDADGDFEGVSTYRWFRGNSVIGGAVAQTYLLVAADENRRIRFEVTPVALTGVLIGTAVVSAQVGPVVDANTAPVANTVSISGTPAVGDTLSGSYVYSDADGDLEGATTFQWLRDGAVIGGATTTSYDVVVADVGTTIQFEVTPVALTGVLQGVAVTSTGVVISNTTPVITGQVVLSTPEETGLEILLTDLTVTDPDNAYPADFTLTAQAGLNYTLVSNIVTPNLDFNGDLTVPVIVNDGSEDSLPFNVVIEVTAVNDAPQIIAQQLLTTMEDFSLTVVLTDVTVLDPDNLPADITLTLLPGANYTLAGNLITPLENFNGPLTVGATVSDGLLTSAVFPLAIDVESVNDLPALEIPIGPQNAVEAALFSLDVSANFTDADLEALSFVATGLPASGNILFDPVTGVFTGTPQFEDTDPIAVHDVTVIATDALGAFAVDMFQLTISALDRANVSLAVNVAPLPAMVNDQLVWTFTARNPLGPQIATNVELSGSFFGSGVTISGPAACTIQAPVGQVTDFLCAMGTLAVGGSTSIVMNAATTAVGDVFVSATAAGADPVPIDPNPIDNADQMAAGVSAAFSAGAVQVLGNSNVRSVTAGDVNGDGITDLIVGTAPGQSLQIYLSGGFRDFLAAPISLADTSSNEGVALADFDNNGTLDLVVANGSGQADRVYGNDGAGNFTPMATLDASFGQGVAVGDFDNDGDMDIVIATSGGNPAYLGNGSGGFSLHATLGAINSQGVAVARLNNDSRDDVVFANVNGDSEVWTKNSGGGFTLRDLLPIGDASSVTVGQFGGNGRLDLAFGRLPGVNGDVPANPVVINDGSGLFGNPIATLGASPTFDILSGDVNRDSMTDLVFVNSSGVHQIWTANGAGFDLYREQIVDNDSVAGVLTDLGEIATGDPGGVDLAMGGAAGAGLGVFLNDGAGNLGLGDAVSPVLTLLGNASVNVPSGTGYTDAGATADDNIDGDISGSIALSGSVNTSSVGTYTLTYNVVDRAGNSATPITRTVSVTPAAGTGGGGGGVMTYWMLLILLVALTYRQVHQTRRVRIRIEFRDRNFRGLKK